MAYGCKCNCESFREHALGVSFSSSAMPTRQAANARIEATEEQWSKDGDAYRRLRADGLQPPDVDGAAALEAGATDKIEIDKGKVLGTEGVALHKAAAESIGEAS